MADEHPRIVTLEFIPFIQGGWEQAYLIETLELSGFQVCYGPFSSASFATTIFEERSQFADELQQQYELDCLDNHEFIAGLKARAIWYRHHGIFKSSS